MKYGGMEEWRNVEAWYRLIVGLCGAQNKRHYVPRRKPACANVSEEKRRTV